MACANQPKTITPPKRAITPNLLPARARNIASLAPLVYIRVDRAMNRPKAPVTCKYVRRKNPSLASTEASATVPPK